MTTARPRASRAPLRSRWRRMTIVIEQQGVGAQALADGLDRDHVLGRDVAEVHVRPEVLDEPDLLGLARRLEDDAAGVDLHLDLVDESRLDLARRVVDADGARLAPLDDHLPRTGPQLALDLIDPPAGRDDLGTILAADLGEHREVLRHALDVAELLGEGDLDGAVRDLDELEAVIGEEGDVLLQLLAVDGELEEAAAAADIDAVAAERLQLGLEVLHHHRGGPAELDDVDVAFPDLEHPLGLGDREPLVDHLREAGLAGLVRASRVAEELRALRAGDDSRLRCHGRPSSTPRAMQASSDAAHTPPCQRNSLYAPGRATRSGGAGPPRKRRPRAR